MGKLLLFALLLTGVAPLFAASWHGETEGVFRHPRGSSHMVTEGEGTNFFNWGSALPGSSLSFLQFSGRQFKLDESKTFVFGALSYHNGANWRGTEANSINLDIQLNFNTPVIHDLELTLDLDLISTPNFGGSNKAADSVDFGIGYPEQRFTVDGKSYWLSLVGLDDVSGDGFLNTHSFRVLERGTASVNLIGEIRPFANEVPVPAGFWLMISALPILRKISKNRLYVQ